MSRPGSAQDDSPGQRSSARPVKILQTSAPEDAELDTLPPNGLAHKAQRPLKPTYPQVTTQNRFCMQLPAGPRDVTSRYRRHQPL